MRRRTSRSAVTNNKGQSDHDPRPGRRPLDPFELAGQPSRTPVDDKRNRPALAVDARRKTAQPAVVPHECQAARAKAPARAGKRAPEEPEPSGRERRRVDRHPPRTEANERLTQIAEDHDGVAGFGGNAERAVALIDTRLHGRVGRNDARAIVDRHDARTKVCVGSRGRCQRNQREQHDEPTKATRSSSR